MAFEIIKLTYLLISLPSKNVLKLTLALPGVYFVSWGCTYKFFL